MSLYLGRREVMTAFDLLGADENAMTTALGFALDHAPVFRSAFVAACGGPSSAGTATIRLQTGRVDHGITDIEIDLGKEFFGIVEAKQGAWLPTVEQLKKYAPIVADHVATTRHLVTLSDSPRPFAEATLPPAVDGQPLHHLTWRQVLGLASASMSSSSQPSRRILRDLQDFLGALIGMESLYSNRVYVVSLANGTPDGWATSWIDVVAKHRRYFYPVSNRWPPPPNYIGFRYRGQLQTIHHVESYEIFTDPATIFPDVPSKDWGSHYLLTLGPEIRPPRKVKTGPRIHMSNRCWCMLDTLLTKATISDALTATEERIAAWEKERSA